MAKQAIEIDTIQWMFLQRHKQGSDMAFAPGMNRFIPGSDHANICLAWNKSISAWRNSQCLDAALD